MNGFVPPADWAGFTEAEMLAAKFFINQAEDQGDNPAGTSITKKADGSYEVTLKTVTSSVSRASVVWVDFADGTVFRNSWYASLTLPTAGVRPVKVQIIPVPKGLKGADGAIAWDCSQDSDTTGDLPASKDGLYVVGDLSMHWGTEEVKVDDFAGLAIWLIWAPVGTEDGADYTFTIKDLKVLPHDISAHEPEPEMEGWTPPAYDPAPALTDWIDLPMPAITASFPSGATIVPNGSGGYTVTAKTRADGHTEITFKGTDFAFTGGYYLRLKLPTLTAADTNKPKRVYMRPDDLYTYAIDKQQANKWVQGEFDCYYEHEEFIAKAEEIVLSIYWHEGAVAGEDYVFTINSIKVAEEATEAPSAEVPEIDEASSQLDDNDYTIDDPADPLEVVVMPTENSENYEYSWWEADNADTTSPTDTDLGNDTPIFLPPTETAGTFYYYCIIEFEGVKTFTRIVTITVNE